MSRPDDTLLLLSRRLARQSPLSYDDIAALEAVAGNRRVIEPASYILREGEPARYCSVLLSGYAFRQKLTSDGARQIISLHIPGDALDFQSLYLERADHNVQALSRADVLFVPIATIRALVETRPAIARAIIVNILTESSIMRESLLNIGRRDARTRLAHFLCEFATRLRAQGLAEEHAYELPMTQEQLGDALGLTSVHVNRTLKALEAEGVLVRQGRRIQFTDRHTMQRIADFSALYLHLDEGMLGDAA